MAGENYIGSKISLISLSDIRYVGILHSINAQDSTVGLKQVRSFGTEGRRGDPEKEILPSDNVFDYVVFRGSDIKDLQVFEAPPPKPAPSALPQDPAIMSMGSYPPPPAAANNNYGYMQQPPPSTSNYYQPPTTQDNREQEQLEKETLDNLKSELEEADNTLDEDAVDQLAKKVSELNPTENEEEETKVQEQRSKPRYNNRGGRHYQQQRTYNKNLVIPKSEFDFEASNAKFDKREITAEKEEEKDQVETPESEDFYDKKSSFFDNISCESKERSEQQNEPRRSHFHEERKLNMETFGQSTVNQSRYRNNNYRGRGRGNQRGGYYRYNNNNNRQQQQQQDQ